MKHRHYSIKVRGYLGSSWSEWFEGLEMKDESTPLGECTSTISGRMDQAALHGTLGKIRDLGIELLSVHIVTEKD